MSRFVSPLVACPSPSRAIVFQCTAARCGGLAERNGFQEEGEDTEPARAQVDIRVLHPSLTPR